MIHVGDKRIFLTGQTGTLNTAEDLINLFHEIGHIETRPEGTLSPDGNTNTRFGTKAITPKLLAYTLQRERDANAWVLQHCAPLFKQIGIPPQLVQNYIHSRMLSTYHQMIRKCLKALMKEDDTP